MWAVLVVVMLATAEATPTFNKGYKLSGLASKVRVRGGWDDVMGWMYKLKL